MSILSLVVVSARLLGRGAGDAKVDAVLAVLHFVEFGSVKAGRETLTDRGTLAPGMRADMNVIDHANMKLEPPEMLFDLPAGGQRFMQRARGYERTLVAGVDVIRDDEVTGELPGRLVRS